MEKILIVEDDLLTAQLYKGVLEQAGYDVQVACDGQKALDFVAKTAPDGILLDVMIPKVNGIAFLIAFRSDPRFQDVPVLVYTNAFVPQITLDAKKAGATDVLEKSKVTPRLLVELFKVALDKQSP